MFAEKFDSNPCFSSQVLDETNRSSQELSFPVSIARRLRATMGLQVRLAEKEFGLLANGECLEVMEQLPAASFNLVLTDLPYGVSQNKWDTVIDLKKLWAAFDRLLKPSGVVVLTATQPFTSILVNSNLKQFKYEWIWEKSIGSGQLNIAHQPLRKHESVLVFYKRKPTYNEQRTEGSPYSIKRKPLLGDGYGAQCSSETINDGFRHPSSVLFFPNPRVKNGHPTQKPVALMEYLIRTYTNPGDIVLDCCLGSGTTAIAAQQLKRQFIGIELSEKYYEMASGRLK